MIKKLLLLFLFVGCTLSSYAQKKPKIIIGKITDSLGIVKNANIINQKTNQGTFSSDQGLYRIFVSEGDTLRFSSVQHKSKKIVITERILDNKELNVKLKAAIYNLDEFDLKRHNLMGRLAADIKDVPTNVKDSLLNDVMDFSNIDFNKVDTRIDEIERAKPPENNVDPTQKFAGAGAAVVMPFKYSERLWALRKELARKKAFPYQILSELGEQFFFDELKIPIEKYFHFLEYCNPLGIEDLHKGGRTLELIKILRSESISYLKIDKKE
ncbi:carboxypeptidase-like regulatory domain-containing protein [Polaribacter vadi]|uniref:carboxypeptidase-like regulatory domain-containing protein n=1 Tax=Polaribacter TaxID=52959 RepID=UPI001C08FFFD|nr:MULTISPECIES: carboxypeptidase-like regulatory domain-containing protein [Polaribacter]MBU3011802.1 carboxypeptidase-like regulatory domain-containing protein [Polaribacter vadi]MDO6741615.1 carboxypeptidase-like regulatory domain-containing protein [Polaribacter sp. 1_MG-2023]